MTESQRAAKRFRREHRPKDSPDMDRADDALTHFGTVVQTGHVVATRRIAGEKIQDLGMRGSRTLEQIQAACWANQGEPFKRLPGNPPDDSIAGTLPDGAMVPVSAVEMVWNDRLSINEIHGPGVYEEIVAGSLEADVLKLAQELYSKEKVQ